MTAMQVHVLRVVESIPLVVECDGPGGRMFGEWRGDAAPAAGDLFDVEIDLLGELSWDEHARPTAEGEGFYGDVAIGLVEDVVDECVTLRIAGSVVLVDAAGTPPECITGQRVAWVTQGFALFPTGA